MLTIDRMTPCAFLDHECDGARSSREIKDHVRAAIREMDRLEYGWDGSSALPLRGDVSIFATVQLCDPVVGVLPFFGVEYPEIQLMGDGRLVLWFSNNPNERCLEIAVPCSRVVIAKKYDDGYTVEERLPADLQELAEALGDLAYWLKAKVPR